MIERIDPVRFYESNILSPDKYSGYRKRSSDARHSAGATLRWRQSKVRSRNAIELLWGAVPKPENSCLSKGKTRNKTSAEVETGKERLFGAAVGAAFRLFIREYS